MLIRKFSAASAATFPAAPCAIAQTETRLPELRVSAPRAGAQGYTLLFTLTGAAAPVHELAAQGVVLPNKMLRAQSALPLDDAIHHASSPSLFDKSPLPRSRAALFANSLME